MYVCVCVCMCVCVCVCVCDVYVRVFFLSASVCICVSVCMSACDIQLLHISFPACQCSFAISSMIMKAYVGDYGYVLACFT